MVCHLMPCGIKLSSYLSRQNEKLMKEGDSPTLLESSKTCIGCVKDKLTKIKRNRSTQSSNLLKVIHSDISGPLLTATHIVYFLL